MVKRLGLAFLVLVGASTAAAGEPIARLLGLERIYFEHVGAPDRALQAPDVVAALLPEMLDPTARSEGEVAVPRAGPLDPLHVLDVALSPEGRDPQRWLRQVVDRGHPRISETWWALYDGGRRSDVWRFRAAPDRTDGKALSNYRIEDISGAPAGAMILRVRGEMFRPQGAWWITGKTFVFARTDRGLELLRVRNDFGFFRGYDRLDSAGTLTPGTFTVSSEREVEGRFETRRVAGAPEELLDECGFVDPLLDDTMTRSRERLEAVARCVTRHPDAVTESRPFDEPSFVERGGGGKD